MRKHNCPHCGCEIDDERRSTPQHHRYMGLIRKAFEHWPETHPFRPLNEHHLRKWLQVRAGYKTVKHIQAPVGWDEPAVLEAFVRALFRETDTYVFLMISDTDIICHVPKSIRYSQLGHKAACRLFDEVEGIIESEVGVSGEQLLKEQAA